MEEDDGRESSIERDFSLADTFLLLTGGFSFFWPFSDTGTEVLGAAFVGVEGIAGVSTLEVSL